MATEPDKEHQLILRLPQVSMGHTLSLVNGIDISSLKMTSVREQKFKNLTCVLSLPFSSQIFAQDHANRVLEAMKSESLDERLQVEFVSE